MFFTKSFASSGVLQGIIDCHSHLLPGVDDGVKKIEDTISILSLLEEQGVRKIWFTPHVMEDIPNKKADLLNRFAKVKTEYKGNLELSLAAEYMLDNQFNTLLEADELLPLEEGKHYLLVETSYFNAPIRFHEMLDNIKAKGYFPLLAHPERYEYMDMNDYKQLKERGISFQLNIPSLAGFYGRHVKEKAERILKADMYDMKGNDIHSRNAINFTLKSPISRKSAKKCNEFG